MVISTMCGQENDPWDKIHVSKNFKGNQENSYITLLPYAPKIAYEISIYQIYKDCNIYIKYQ